MTASGRCATACWSTRISDWRDDLCVVRVSKLGRDGARPSNLKRRGRIVDSAVAKKKGNKGLTLLGHNESIVPTAPSVAILESFENPSRRPYRIEFQSGDFTSLCPITGQADFARITIDYEPAKRCLETKSLKFYLSSYRNERAFNEDVTNHILDDLVRACRPRKMTIRAEFAPRGGIALTVTAKFPKAE